MSDETHHHDALHSYIEKWLAVQPEQRVALVFVDAKKYPGHIALAALEQELLSAAYGIREPQVAAVKLNWWAEELAGAAHSGGRHPLTRVLFDDERAHALPQSLWLAPIMAAMAQLEEGTATDFPAQLTAAASFHGALAALETAWWFGADASPARATQVATLAHLLYALRRLQDDADRDRLPLPMARLAKFDLSRADLRQASVARDQAIRAQVQDLRDAWTAAGRLTGPLSVFRALESRQGQRLVIRSTSAPDTLKALQNGLADTGFAITFSAWRAATRWRRDAPART